MADVIIDSSGDSSKVPELLKLLGKQGVLILTGCYTEPITIDPAELNQGKKIITTGG